MDGYEVASAFAAQGDGSPTWSRSPATASAEDRQRARQAGFDWHLIKPPKHDELTRLLSELPRGQS